MTIWFTADQHFSHENIIEYCDRPFKSANKMNATIIRQYNELVQAEDTVYFIGDLSSWYEIEVKQLAKIIRKLKGHKVLILGSHDKFPVFDYVDMGFESVHTYLHLKELNLHLVHDPAVSNILQHEWWVCGHVHNLFKRNKHVINVGVDVWDFCPVSLEDVEQCFDGKSI